MTAHWKQPIKTANMMTRMLINTSHGQTTWAVPGKHHGLLIDTRLSYTNVLSNLNLGAKMAHPSETKLLQTIMQWKLTAHGLLNKHTQTGELNPIHHNIIVAI